jgi:hypothetical protein
MSGGADDDDDESYTPSQMMGGAEYEDSDSVMLAQSTDSVAMSAAEAEDLQLELTRAELKAELDYINLKHDIKAGQELLKQIQQSGGALITVTDEPATTEQTPTQVPTEIQVPQQAGGAPAGNVSYAPYPPLPIWGSNPKAAEQLLGLGKRDRNILDKISDDPVTQSNMSLLLAASGGNKVIKHNPFDITYNVKGAYTRKYDQLQRKQKLQQEIKASEQKYDAAGLV